MSLSFEEMADAGIPADRLRSGKRFGLFSRVLLLVLLLFLGSGLVYYFYFFKLTPELPDSMEHLIVVDADVPEGVMPHQFDEATEFENALQRHKEYYRKPQYRETPLATRAVPAKPVPEDIKTAVIAQQSEQNKFTEWTKKPLGKLKDTWAQLFENTEEAYSSEIDREFARTADGPRLPTDGTSSREKSVANGVNQKKRMRIDSEPVASVSEAPVESVNELDEDAVVEIDLVRDWAGLVLVPDGVQLARAYTSGVRLNRVEAHPIDGERLRVWARIENLTDQDLTVETACEFRFADEARSLPSFRASQIPVNGALDVYYVSSMSGVNAYTLMVKR